MLSLTLRLDRFLGAGHSVQGFPPMLPANRSDLHIYFAHPSGSTFFEPLEDFLFGLRYKGIQLRVPLVS